MPLTLDVRSDEQSVRRYREATAKRVLECLGLQHPSCRLLCFLDDQCCQEFKKECGTANRGLYSPVRLRYVPFTVAPACIRESLLHGGVQVFDDFIYLHGCTCSNEVSLTMTLAHELQHFVQHTNQTRLWAANSLIPRLTKDAVRDLELTWCDIPHEREARIVSKRAAEGLLGAEAVQRHIDAMIAKRPGSEDAEDWRCVRGLVTSAPYDLATETKLFFPRLSGYRQQLEDALFQFQYRDDPDFEGIDLEELLSGAGA
jgi:hypothetical protein